MRDSFVLKLYLHDQIGSINVGCDIVFVLMTRFQILSAALCATFLSFSIYVFCFCPCRWLPKL